MCIGGVLGKIAGAIGWTACAELANVAYYPFINKMTISLMLPIFIPPPLGVSAGLEVNLNLGDLTPAVYKHCGSQGHKEFNCLQSMFDARGPTGVKVYVKVLIGVKIPVLGEAGHRPASDIHDYFHISVPYTVSLVCVVSGTHISTNVEW